MKFLSGKLVSSLLLIAVFLLAGCGGNSSAPAPKGDFPPAPSGLMQAELTKLDGTKFKLADYKGKTILVNVWATWCPPCREEIPDLVDLKEELKDKNFEVIGLNLSDEDDIDAIKSFSALYKINYEMAKGEDALFREFVSVSKQPAIPQSFLIDSEGRLNGVFVGGGKSLQRLLDSSRALAGSQ